MKTLILLILMATTLSDQPRKVLLFFNKYGEKQMKSQVKNLNTQKTGMKEMDIEVVCIPYSKENAAQFKQWDVDTADKLTFILVGRDGGEKHRSIELVTSEKLFGLIDAIPMRKSEMKKVL